MGKKKNRPLLFSIEWNEKFNFLCKLKKIPFFPLKTGEKYDMIVST